MANLTSPDGCQGQPTDTDEEAIQPKIIIHVAMGMVALLAVCGILGNALVIFVFSRQKHKLSSTIFILTLALTDFITSLVTMPYTVVIELMDYNIGYDFPCKLYQFMKTTTIPFSAFVMVAIALDRYLCIVYPFKHIMTIKRAKMSVAMLSVLAFAIGIMSSLMIGTYHELKTDSECVTRNNNHTKVITYAGDDNSMTRTNNSISLINIDTSLNDLDLKSGVNETGSISTPLIINTGKCSLTSSILTRPFIFTFLRMYSSLFGICAVAVIILYGLTYRSVLAHRRKRLNISNRCWCMMGKGDRDEDTIEQTEFTTLQPDSPNMANGNGRESIRLQEKYDGTGESTPQAGRNGNSPIAQQHKTEQDNHARPGGVSRAKLKKLRVANIKTALMLSIVAFLFIVAFTPAWLMALHLIPMNVIVYYLYFTYNVANPVIYAFLNNSFRTHLQAMFRCKA